MQSHSKYFELDFEYFSILINIVKKKKVFLTPSSTSFQDFTLWPCLLLIVTIAADSNFSPEHREHPKGHYARGPANELEQDE